MRHRARLQSRHPSYPSARGSGLKLAHPFLIENLNALIIIKGEQEESVLPHGGFRVRCSRKYPPCLLYVTHCAAFAVVWASAPCAASCEAWKLAALSCGTPEPWKCSAGLVNITRWIMPAGWRRWRS